MHNTLILAVSAVIACSSSQSTISTRTALPASTEPTAEPTKRAESRGDHDSASAHLERAFSSFRQADHPAAAKSFSAAIQTGDLYDSGRALAYWHVYVSQAQLGHIDASADALMSFTVIAEDLLVASTQVGRHDVDREFIERFELASRLDRARATLSALWVDRVIGYGRSSRQPIQVSSTDELRIFIELAPPCQGVRPRQVNERTVKSDGAIEILEVTLYCRDHLNGSRFIIEKRVESGRQ